MIKHHLLFKALNQWSEIPQSEWEALLSVLKERRMQKGEVFLKEGQVAREVAFIISGYCRQYFTDEKGQEFNHNFNFENTLMAGYSSLLEKKPSQFTIEAMEECDLLVCTYDTFESFYERHICWERLGRKVAEFNYLIKMQREAAFLLMDATERYLDAIESQPEIKSRVPQYHLASYLGITASALNRIIKKIKAD